MVFLCKILCNIHLLKTRQLPSPGGHGGQVLTGCDVLPHFSLFLFPYTRRSLGFLELLQLLVLSTELFPVSLDPPFFFFFKNSVQIWLDVIV